MSGSRPLPDAVTRSTGIGALLVGSTAWRASIRAFTASVSAGLSGPRFEPVEPVPLYGCGVVAEGRLQKYFGSLNGCPMRLDPIALPLRTIRLPPAWVGKRTWPIPVTTSGHTIPVMAIRRRKRTTAGRTIEFMSGLPSDELREHQCEIAQLDTQ